MSTHKKNISIGKIFVYKFYSLLGLLCQIAFSVFSRKKIVADRELADYDLVLFSGQRGAKMMKALLLSIYHRWERIPRLTVVTDGSPKEIFEEVLHFWPFPFEIKSWEVCAAYHLERQRESIVDFARNNIYARKVLAVLAEAETRPILYCDTDVLWFAEPRLPVAPPKEAFVMRISLDNIHCYLLPAIHWLHRFDLLEKPPMNAGVIYLSGSVYAHYPGFGELMEFMKIFDDGRAEQMTFALLADRLGDTWRLEEILLDTTDKYWPLVPNYLFSDKHFARHHVVTKHSWFWRDALFLILLKRKKQPGLAAI